MKIQAGIALLAICSSTWAEVFRVPGDFPTVQIAIQGAEQGDTIILLPQVHFEAINFNGKQITIQSEDPLNPSVVAATVINAFGLGSVVTFLGTEVESSKLFGVTITGGQVGVFGNDARATIANCVVKNCDIGIRDMDGLIRNCQITNNRIGLQSQESLDIQIEQTDVSNNDQTGINILHGKIKFCNVTFNRDGIVVQHNGSPLIQDTVASFNTFSGIASGSVSTAQISRCRIAGNGASGIDRIMGAIENSIIVGNNTFSTGGGIARCEGRILNCTVAYNGVGFFSCSGEIKHCVIWDNGIPLVNSSTPILSGTVDPLFVRLGGWNQQNDVWMEGDYHLLPDSPYIDAGDPSYGNDPDDPVFDIDGNPRVAGSRVDIGAYEFSQNCDGLDFDSDGVPDICDGDIDNDGVNNSSDPCDFTPSSFLTDEVGRPRADLNKDCVVNLLDFAIMQRSFQE